MKWLQAYESFKNDNPKKYFIIYNRDIPPISGRDSSINYKMNNMLISNIFDDIIILTETSLNQIQDWLKTINPGDMIFSYNNNSLRTYEKLNPSQKKLKYIAETLRRKKDIKFWINDSFTRSKTDYYNLLKNYDFMPKTCFSKKEALETLNFPIVAKPEGGSLGIGIQKFNTKGEFEKTRYRFDVFSEYVKHKAEFRVLVLNGKIIFVVERINEFSDKNNIDHKTKNSEVMHIYVPQNMDTFPYLKKIQKVVNIIDKRLGKHTESVYSKIREAIESYSALSRSSRKNAEFHSWEVVVSKMLEHYEDAVDWNMGKKLIETYRVTPIKKREERDKRPNKN